ncbi:hypothetical protein DSO57_1039668 [Entomophthora muscae]|uniref:Uncharacterized protein n=1 Tax=Entomophthora muscae TaxID=34485 RepID=A0ACC2TIH2_9FUNG|nr:hypothetical protein DSO57_1039668 [Entomophthora muscae]
MSKQMLTLKTLNQLLLKNLKTQIWYCFGLRQRHAPYVETAQFPPIIHPKAPWLVLGYTSSYYLLNHFTPFLRRFCLFGHLLHMLMIGVPVGSTLIKFNLGALLHSIGERLPNEWIPDTNFAIGPSLLAVPILIGCPWHVCCYRPLQSVHGTSDTAYTLLELDYWKLLIGCAFLCL